MEPSLFTYEKTIKLYIQSLQPLKNICIPLMLIVFIVSYEHKTIFVYIPYS